MKIFIANIISFFTLAFVISFCIFAAFNVVMILIEAGLQVGLMVIGGFFALSLVVLIMVWALKTTCDYYVNKK